MTLTEVLVSITILGLSVTGIASGLGTAAMSSDRHRKEVTADTLVRDYAEAIKEYVRVVGYADEDTAAETAAKYSYESIHAATGFTKPEDYDIGLAAERGIQFQSSASLNVILVLDTSTSVAEAGAQENVRNAARLFIRELSDSGAQVALINFDETATVAKDATPVTAVTLPLFDQAITDLVFEGTTNWDDALGTAFSALDDFGNPVPPLVVFVTDGNPNRWIVNDSNPKQIGCVPWFTYFCTSTTSDQAVNEAKEQKVLIEDLYHSRIFAIGVPGMTGLDVDNLKAISGPDQFPGTPFEDADWMQVSGFSDLELGLQQIAQDLRKDYFSTEKPRSGDQGAQLLTLVASSKDGRASETLQTIVRRP
jgi:uncharacterized protein YegL